MFRLLGEDPWPYGVERNRANLERFIGYPEDQGLLEKKLRKARTEFRSAIGTRKMIRGVISDTHGLLRQEAMAALAESALIIHAGDIGKPEVLEGLRKIAPLVAVRGNNDHGPWAEELRETEMVEIGGVKLYILHDLKTLKVTTDTKHYSAVIAGHSHRPRIDKRDGALFINPGSAGPRRFKLPVSVARLRVSGVKVEAELIELKV